MINELVAKLHFYIVTLPIFDSYKSFYLDYLERTRQANIPDTEKLRKLKILLEAIKARHTEHWLNSPLGFFLGWITDTLQDIGNIPLDIARPRNLIPIVLGLAVVAFFVFLIIAKR